MRPEIPFSARLEARLQVFFFLLVFGLAYVPFTFSCIFPHYAMSPWFLAQDRVVRGCSLPGLLACLFVSGFDAPVAVLEVPTSRYLQVWRSLKSCPTPPLLLPTPRLALAVGCCLRLVCLLSIRVFQKLQHPAACSLQPAGAASQSAGTNSPMLGRRTPRPFPFQNRPHLGHMDPCSVSRCPCHIHLHHLHPHFLLEPQ